MNHARICTCHHGHLSHRHMPDTRSNTGDCLAPNCGCRAFEEAS